MKRVNKIFKHPLFKSTLEKIESCEKNRIYCLHDFTHIMDVARIAYIIALECKSDIDKETIYAASLLHDLGRFGQYTKGIAHSTASAELAKEILPQCGFVEKEVGEIISAISSHGDDNNANGLAYILNKADKLSRMCMNCNAISTCKWKEEELNKEIMY